MINATHDILEQKQKSMYKIYLTKNKTLFPSYTISDSFNSSCIDMKGDNEWWQEIHFTFNRKKYFAMCHLEIDEDTRELSAKLYPMEKNGKYYQVVVDDGVEIANQKD